MNRTRPIFLVALVGLVGLLALFGGAVAGCSSSSKTTTASSIVSAISAAVSSAVAESSSAAPISTTASTASSAAATSLDLSGKWSGQYGGTYQGTFTLNWQQAGSNLTGSIAISNPPQTLSLNGTLSGTTITFGTVGSLAITYTGTASASSMSGTYSVGGQNAGNWSASKSS